MNVNLAPQLEALVRAKVDSGLNSSASEALRLMSEQDRLKRAKFDELRRDVHDGLASGASEPRDASALKQKARARRATKVTTA